LRLTRSPDWKAIECPSISTLASTCTIVLSRQSAKRHRGPGFFQPREPVLATGQEAGASPRVLAIAHPAAASRSVDLGDQERAKIVGDLAIILAIEVERGQQPGKAAVVCDHCLAHPVAVTTEQDLNVLISLRTRHCCLPYSSPSPY